MDSFVLPTVERSFCKELFLWRLLCLSDWTLTFLLCSIVLQSQTLIQQGSPHFKDHPPCYIFFFFFFLFEFPSPSHPLSTGFWHPDAITWLCSGTCGVCAASAGTRWAPVDSPWTASVASPPAHALHLEHTETQSHITLIGKRNYMMLC